MKKPSSFSKKMTYLSDFFTGHKYIILKNGKIVVVCLGCYFFIDRQVLAAQQKTYLHPFRNIASVTIEKSDSGNPRIRFIETPTKVSQFDIAMQAVIQATETLIPGVMQRTFQKGPIFRYPGNVRIGGFTKTTTIKDPNGNGLIHFAHTFEFDQRKESIKYTRTRESFNSRVPVEEYYFDCPARIFGNLNMDSVPELIQDLANSMIEFRDYLNSENLTSAERKLYITSFRTEFRYITKVLSPILKCMNFHQKATKMFRVMEPTLGPGLVPYQWHHLLHAGQVKELIDQSPQYYESLLCILNSPANLCRVLREHHYIIHVLDKNPGASTLTLDHFFNPTNAEESYPTKPCITFENDKSHHRAVPKRIRDLSPQDLARNQIEYANRRANTSLWLFFGEIDGEVVYKIHIGDRYASAGDPTFVQKLENSIPGSTSHYYTKIRDWSDPGFPEDLKFFRGWQFVGSYDENGDCVVGGCCCSEHLKGQVRTTMVQPGAINEGRRRGRRTPVVEPPNDPEIPQDQHSGSGDGPAPGAGAVVADAGRARSGIARPEVFGELQTELERIKLKEALDQIKSEFEKRFPKKA